MRNFTLIINQAFYLLGFLLFIIVLKKNKCKAKVTNE